MARRIVFKFDDESKEEACRQLLSAGMKLGIFPNLRVTDDSSKPGQVILTGGDREEEE
jgi:hypothetical protein